MAQILRCWNWASACHRAKPCSARREHAKSPRPPAPTLPNIVYSDTGQTHKTLYVERQHGRRAMLNSIVTMRLFCCCVVWLCRALHCVASKLDKRAALSAPIMRGLVEELAQATLCLILAALHFGALPICPCCRAVQDFPEQPRSALEQALADALEMAAASESLPMADLTCLKDYSVACPEGL